MFPVPHALPRRICRTRRPPGSNLMDQRLRALAFFRRATQDFHLPPRILSASARTLADCASSCCFRAPPASRVEQADSSCSAAIASPAAPRFFSNALERLRSASRLFWHALNSSRNFAPSSVCRFSAAASSRSWAKDGPFRGPPAPRASSRCLSS